MVTATLPWDVGSSAWPKVGLAAARAVQARKKLRIDDLPRTILRARCYNVTCLSTRADRRRSFRQLIPGECVRRPARPRRRPYEDAGYAAGASAQARPARWSRRLPPH